MASLTLQELRRAIRTSIYGSRLGLDTIKDETATYGTGLTAIRGGFLVGHVGQRLPIQYVGSTVGSTLYFGVNVELATNPSTQTFAAPIPGAEFTIFQTAATTAGIQVRLSNGNFATTTGSSPNQITFTGQGAAVRLLGISTALAAVIGYTPSSSNGISTAFIAFSTY